jgi:hypothetical protein
VPHPYQGWPRPGVAGRYARGPDALASTTRRAPWKKWSRPKASTLMSCKSSSPTSLLQTLLLSPKYANLFWLAHFPGYIARSAFITTKPKDIQEYATRLSLETLTCFVIYPPEKDSDPLRRCQGAPKPGHARPEHRSASV